MTVFEWVIVLIFILLLVILFGLLMVISEAAEALQKQKDCNTRLDNIVDRLLNYIEG